MTYAQKLKDPRWQKKRLLVMERDRFACRACRSTKKMLCVHHIRYEKNPWDAPMDDLVTLCDDCHKARHWKEPTVPDPVQEPAEMRPVDKETGRRLIAEMRAALAKLAKP